MELSSVFEIFVILFKTILTCLELLLLVLILVVLDEFVDVIKIDVGRFELWRLGIVLFLLEEGNGLKLLCIFC